MSRSVAKRETKLPFGNGTLSGNVRTVEKPTTAPIDPGSTTGGSTDVRRPPPVPDYELLRRIGSGSYGDVWLARNVLGQFRAR